MNDAILNNYQRWTERAIADVDVINELKDIAENEGKIEDAFYKDLAYIYSKFICKKFYFAERARRGNSGRKLIESYGVANTILYDHGGTTLDK